MSNIILDIQDVHKSFTQGYAGRKGIFSAESRNVINGLDLKLERAKATALVGGNGAGKTSLFNLISGLLRPDEGNILYYGNGKPLDCTNSSPWAIASAGVGRMFQGSRIFEGLTLMDHLLIQARDKYTERPFYDMLRPVKGRRDKKNLEQEIKDKLHSYKVFSDLLIHIDQPASSLSFAQQRLLSMAGLLMGDYKLVMLDEPSSGLSPDTFEPLISLINSMLEKGISVFLIEHNMTFIRQATGICHYMSEGRIQYSGLPEEVLNNEDVMQSYLL